MLLILDKINMLENLRKTLNTSVSEAIVENV